MDNCEHLLAGAAPLLACIARRCPTVRVLATSRERLGIDGERVWPVEPLGLPTGRAAAGHAPAVQLFRDRALAVDPGFALTTAQVPAVAALCRRLDGLPLAIELAAARVGSMTPADILARLDDRFGLLTGGRTAQARHRTLAALMDWSYQLLDPTARRVFDRLSVFAGGATLAAAEAVCTGDAVAEGDVARLVAELVDKSMVTLDRTGSEPRLRLLETLRAYGQDRLVRGGEARAVGRRHAGYFTVLAERADAGIRTPQEARYAIELESEFDNLRAAHETALDAAEVDLGMRLAAALYEFARSRLRFEVFSWAEQVVEQAGAQSQSHPLYPYACRAAAAGPENRGEFARATEFAERGLAATRGPGDPARIVLHHLFCAVGIYQGRLDEALRHAEQMASLARAVDDPYRVCHAGVAQVLCLSYQGKTVEALAVSEQNLREARALGNPTQLAFAFYARGEALAPDEPTTALIALDQAVTTARSVGNRFVESVALVSAVSLRGRHGPPDVALGMFGEVIEHWRRAGDWTHQWVTLRNLVELFTRIGADRAAATLHRAVTTTASGAPVYGSDAQRLTDLGGVLEDRLGGEQWREAITEGDAMTDQQVVAFAAAAITQAVTTYPHEVAG